MENLFEMRRTIVDTIATIIFFTFVAGFTELFVAGMALREVLVTRLIMVPMMVLTGRPYGMWRDWFFESTKPTVSWSKSIIDGLAFVSFQLPIYALVLVISGASRYEILTLLGSTVVIMLVVSRPFGLFLESARRLAGVSDH